MFGIRWRCNRTWCTVPSSIAVHGLAGPTSQCGLNSAQSAYIFRSAKILVPVGSRMYIHIFLLDSELLTSVERFNENHKSYLQVKFNIGKASGRKLDPEVVAKEMRRAHNMHSCHRWGEVISCKGIPVPPADIFFFFTHGS